MEIFESSGDRQWRGWVWWCFVRIYDITVCRRWWNTRNAVGRVNRPGKACLRGLPTEVRDERIEKRKRGGKRHNARGIPRHFRITPAKSPRVFAFPRGERRQKLIAYLRGQQWSAILVYRQLSLAGRSGNQRHFWSTARPPASRPRIRPAAPLRSTPLRSAPRHVVQISFPPVCLTPLRSRKDAEVYRELKTNQAQRQFYPALRTVQFPVSYKWEETPKIIRNVTNNATNCFATLQRPFVLWNMANYEAPITRNFKSSMRK